MTPEKIQKAKKLRLKGISPRDIAEKLKISLNSAYKYTRGLGVQPCHPRYKTKEIQHDYFSKENLANHQTRMVLIGFIAADGCISERPHGGKGQKTLVIRLCKKDSHALQIFNEHLSKGTRTISESKLSKAIDFPSNQICNDLSKYGIIPRKTSVFAWPSCLTKQHAKYFLLGYFYGDGCFHRYKNRDVIHFITTVEFANGLRNFLYKHKIVDHCVVSPRKKAPNYAQIVFQGKHCKKLAKWLFADTSMALLPRKHPH